MSTFQGTFTEFKKLAKEYHDALPTLDYAGVENGFKCLGLAYLSIEFSDDFFGKLHREVEAPAILRLMTKARIAREVQLDAELFSKEQA